MSQNELRFSYKIYSFSSKPRTTVKIICQVLIVRTRIGRDYHFTAGSLLNIVESPVKQGIILRSGHRLFLSIKNIVGMKGGKFIDKYGHWLDRARLPFLFQIAFVIERMYLENLRSFVNRITEHIIFLTTGEYQPCGLDPKPRGRKHHNEFFP